MNHPILLFDGECNFCRACVRWLVKHDSAGRLHFAPLESLEGRELLTAHGVDPGSVESVLLIDDERVWERSEAVFQALCHVDGKWRPLQAARRFPRGLRDFVYNRISHHRGLISRLVGIHHRYEPQGHERERFLAT